MLDPEQNNVSSGLDYAVIAASSSISKGIPLVPLKKRKFEIIEQIIFFDRGIQTDMTSDDIEHLFRRYQEAVEDRDKLLLQLANLVIDVKFFKNNDKRTIFFTGLPSWDVLNHFFKLVEPFLPEHGNCKLSPFQMLVLMMMKFRLNSSFTDLGYRFQVDGNTTSRYFHRCVYILHKLFYETKMISFPERTNLLGNTPSYFRCCFKEKISIIIDCFELFIERSSVLRAAAQGWSTYKHHITLKFLIGISVTGAIIFISSAFGGRASDKFCTSKSGILDKLLDGDFVLADKGFLIEDMVKEKGATLQIPCFVRNGQQLHPSDIEETRNLANVRIHVERIISQLRGKFNITSDLAPMVAISKRNEMFNNDLYDKIVYLCCCLVNLCPPVVSSEFEV